MRKIVLGMAAIVVTLGLSGSVSANLVVNGGFETGDFTDWTLSGNMNLAGIGTEAPHGGTYEAYFGVVGTPAFLTQDLTTTADQGYELTFWLKNEVIDLGRAFFFTASVGGVDAVQLINVSAFDYTKYTYDFTATGATTTLQFSFRHDPGVWHLDDVDVEPTATAVPEPSTLLGAGLAVLTGLVYGWRRRWRS